MAVRIRMKRLGRKHRPYYRIVAIDSRQPRDGRVIEELGTYDPMIKNTDERVKLLPERIKYWVSVGARPSDNVQVFIKKYMAKFEQEPAGTAPKQEPAALGAVSRDGQKLLIKKLRGAFIPPGPLRDRFSEIMARWNLEAQQGSVTEQELRDLLRDVEATKKPEEPAAPTA